MRILFVKLSSIGDIVHTLPALAAVRRALPGAEISWAVEASSAEILRGCEMIDSLIELDTRSLRGGKKIEDLLLDATRQVGLLRKQTFDIAIDFQGLLKSAGVAKLSKASNRYGFAKPNLREPASRFLMTRTFETADRAHVIVKNLALVAKSLGITVPERDFEFPIATDQSHRDEAAKIMESAGENFAILNPAGGWVTKLWPAENFGHLADRLYEDFGMKSVITFGPREEDLAEKALAASASKTAIQARPSLKGFFELARRASVYVGGDTGPTHLAVAANTPIVGIFGPTEWWRNGSPRSEDVCVERTDIGCRTDCHRRRCSNWICMDISVDTVLNAVRNRLGRV